MNLSISVNLPYVLNSGAAVVRIIRLLVFFRSSNILSICSISADLHLEDKIIIFDFLKISKLSFEIFLLHKVLFIKNVLRQKISVGSKKKLYSGKKFLF